MKAKKDIRKYIESSLVFLDLDSKTKDEAIADMLVRAESSGVRINVTQVMNDIYKKEKILTSGLGYGVAFPHTPTSQVDEEVIIFGVSREGIDYSALDKKPVHLLIMFLTPSVASEQYLSHLSMFTKISRLTMYVVMLIESKTREEFIDKMLYLIENIDSKL